MLGPIDYVVISFPGNKFKGNIIPELEKVIDNGSIRIVDLIFVMKDKKGDVSVLEVEDMPPEIAGKLEGIKADLRGLLAEADIKEVSELVDNNSSAALLVFENVWAVGLKAALVEAGGELVANGRIRDYAVAAAIEDMAS